MSAALKVCYAASEVSPFAKTGGLADVASALPRQLHRLGHDVRVFLPFYSVIDREDHGFQVVDFARDVTLDLGGREFRFTLWSTRLPNSQQEVYLVDCPELFRRPGIYTSEPDEPHRFVFFSRAVIESCQRMGWAPDLFHCNDWHTALIPLLLRTIYEWDALFRNSRSLATIHNIGYQGVYPSQVIEQLGLGGFQHLFDQQDLRAGRVNLLRTGLIYAEAVSTVSPTYAHEIQTDDYGMGLQDMLRARADSLVGILNGVDYDEWSPENDRLIPNHFSRSRLEGKRKNKRYLMQQLRLPAADGAPLAGIVSRLTHQKGFDLCFDVLPQALAATDLRLAVLGQGERRYEEFFQTLQDRFPQQVVFYRGHNNELAHLIEAGSDIFLMPSRYEPCGLNQMFSLRYGTVPIVRRTGGLADSVRLYDERTGEGTGFVFDEFNAEAFAWALRYALSTFRQPQRWRQLMKNAMAEDFSWEIQARHYVDLYSRLSGKSAG